MYSPKELEGEVDHSFFDSDCEASGLGSEDGQLNKQKAMERPDEKTGKETHVSMDQIGNEAQNVRNGKDEARLEDDSNRGSRGQSEETEYEKERQSSDGLFKGSEIVNNNQSDEGSSVHSYSSDEERELDDAFKLRKTKVNVNCNDDDDDGYHQSDDESEEDVRSPVTRSTKHKAFSHGTLKKSAGKFHKLSRSRSSSSDPESSHSSEERSSFQSLKSPVKHQRVASAYQKERPKETAESEDTVTDVTPLSTPNVSPSQSIDVALPSEPMAADVQQQQQPSVTEKMVANDVSDGQDSISSEGEDGPGLCHELRCFVVVVAVSYESLSPPCSVFKSRETIKQSTYGLQPWQCWQQP